MLSHLASPAGSPCTPLPAFPRMSTNPLSFLITASPFLPRAILFAKFSCCIHVAGAMLIMGGPPTPNGAHHACIISPEGDYLVEHVSASVCLPTSLGCWI